MHAGLFPYWGERLNKTRLYSHQVSQRLGILEGEILADRVFIRDDVMLFAESLIVLQK